MDRWRVLDALSEPRRRAVFEHVRAAGRPQTRDDVAAALGTTRALAAFHLDRLASDGLLAVDYARPSGRRGPGAGRPAKRYQPAELEVDLSVPERHYDVVARVLARAIVDADRDRDPTQAAAEAAYDEGARVGAVVGGSDEVLGVLGRLGYEPRVSDDDAQPGSIVLGNCPFHRVVAEAPALVCGINLAYLDGVLHGCGARGVAARLDPAEGRCCVVVDPSDEFA